MQSANNHLTIGLISDTHGNLPPTIHNVFKGVNAIVHAGDIGEDSILIELGEIAPITAVRGNMDWGDWARPLPVVQILNMGGIRIGVTHDPLRMPGDLLSAGCRVIVCGHTHQALVEEKNGVLYVNPGSAGQPRRSRPASAGLLYLRDGLARAEIIQLEQWYG